MSGIMRAPSPMNSVIIPLNGRELKENDCVVVIYPGDSTKSVLFVYAGRDWVQIGGPIYDCSVNPAGDSVLVNVLYDTVSSNFYACFLPSPISG